MIKSHDSEANKLILYFDNPDISKLVLTKIEKDIEVYALKAIGSVDADIRISTHLGDSKDLEKFGGIDCGDFDG